jgi:hypothetical protein
MVQAVDTRDPYSVQSAEEANQKGNEALNEQRLQDAVEVIRQIHKTCSFPSKISDSWNLTFLSQYYSRGLAIVEGKNLHPVILSNSKLKPTPSFAAHMFFKQYARNNSHA